MRFVAGRDAVAKRLVRGAAVEERHRENVAGQTPWQKGKPPQQEGRGNKTVARRPWQAKISPPQRAKKKARRGEQEKAGQGEQEKKASRTSRQLEAAGAGGD